MSAVAAAVIGTAAIGGAVASKQAADKAADAQRYASDQAIQAQRSEFDKSIALLQPYVDTGTEAIDIQKAMLGLSGAEQQQKVIDDVSSQPELQMLIDQGEEALLQNASATGGLRGGNVQRALAEFRPQVLSSLLNQRYERLGGLASLGQASASQQALQGQQLGGSIADQLTQQGAFTAQNRLATGNAFNQGLSGVTQAFGVGFGGTGGLGGKF